MRSFSFAPVYSLLLACCLTLATTGAKAADSGDGNKARKAAGTAAKRNAELVPNSRAWAEAQQRRVDRYATANRLSTELLSQLNLTTDATASAQVETLVAQLLGTNTADGYLPATLKVYSLEDLLRNQTTPMQRALASWLPQPSYDRYVALLDGLGVK